MATLEQICLIKEHVEDDLLRMPGVTAVGVGCKSIGGERTDILCIIVYVEHKTNAVDPVQLIPSRIYDVPTDVIEAGFVVANSLPEPVESIEKVSTPDPGRYNPLVGGISMGPSFGGTGTLGAIVQDRSNVKYALSCHHVMFNTYLDPGGTLLIQPGTLDGGASPGDLMAIWTRGYVGGKFDCAIAALGSQRLGNLREIVDIGNIAGVNTQPRVNDILRKRGRSTLQTSGPVSDLKWSGYFSVRDRTGVQRTYLMRDQLRINRQMGDPPICAFGDSGSLWLDNHNNVVGLNFGAALDGSFALANFIAPVLTVLGVSF